MSSSLEMTKKSSRKSCELKKKVRHVWLAENDKISPKSCSSGSSEEILVFQRHSKHNGKQSQE